MRPSSILLPLLLACDDPSGLEADGSPARGALATTTGPSSLVLFLSALGVPTLAEDPTEVAHDFIGGVAIDDDFDFVSYESSKDAGASVALNVLLGPTLTGGQVCLIGTAYDDGDYMPCSVARHANGGRTISVDVSDDIDVGSYVIGDDYDASTTLTRSSAQSYTFEIDAAGRVSGETAYDVRSTLTLREPDVYPAAATGARPVGPAFCDHLGAECENRLDAQDCADPTGAGECRLELADHFRADVAFEGFVLDGSHWSSLRAGTEDDNDATGWGFARALTNAYPWIVTDDVDLY
ncbi:MAG TPA: hypothetical protein PKA64_17965 [Myxococcota bacterium]|nr:hypothetical protein [Myxococcota bacterium]